MYCIRICFSMCIHIRLRICTHICISIRKCICMYMTRNRSWNRNRSRNRNRIQIKCRNRNWNRNRLQIFRFRNPGLDECDIPWVPRGIGRFVLWVAHDVSDAILPFFVESNVVKKTIISNPEREAPPYGFGSHLGHFHYYKAFMHGLVTPYSLLLC
jgi:hypothetical protein